jgi:hypothetical protein
MTANTNPLPVTHGEFGFPRRSCLDANHQAELAIRAAIDAVEALGADPLLTQAVTKLGEAKDLVAGWLEGKTG